MIKTVPLSLLLFCLTFTLFGQVNDNNENAIELTDIDNWTSTNGQFTNVGASFDGPAVSCNDWSASENVWFSFTSISKNIAIKLLTGGNEGTLQYPMLTLFDKNLIEIECKKMTGVADIEIFKEGIEKGEKYYISVNSYPTTAGTFTLAVNGTFGFNYLENAIELTELSDWSSDEGIYNNIGANADIPLPSCLPTANSNVWFSFRAISSKQTIKVLTSDTQGTLVWPVVTLFDSEKNEIACNYQNYIEDMELASNNLTIGAIYYFSVSTNTGRQGTFSLYLNDDVGNDYVEKAYEIIDIANYSSVPKQFSNVGASFDGSTVSCNVFNGNKNVWFKFSPNSNEASIKLLTGGDEGTLQYPILTLFDKNLHEIECKYMTGPADLTINRNDLIANETYYFTVNSMPTTAGSFTLGSYNPIQTLYATTSGAFTDPTIWSLTPNGTRCNCIPGSRAEVIIDGYTIEINTDVQTGNVTIKNSNSGLNVTSGTLTVNGKVNLLNTNGTGQPNINISSSGNLICVEP